MGRKLQYNDGFGRRMAGHSYRDVFGYCDVLMLRDSGLTKAERR